MTAGQIFVAGIDGGGTKTTVVCQDLKGEVFCRRTYGAFNINSIGKEGLWTLLGEITDFLRSQGQCEALCIGAAGSSSQQMRTVTEAAMEAAGIHRWLLVGDHEIAHFGALAGRPGCVIAAGTGSICFGKNVSGESFRAGGWGHLIGDEGSGYALGRDALAAVARWHDGYGESTLLAELLAAEKGIYGREKIIGYAYGGDKSRIAALSPFVERAAARKDAAAVRIIQKNAGELVKLAQAVVRHLSMEDGEIALLGGVLSPNTGMRRAFLLQLHTALPGVACIEPEKTPADGAADMAGRLLEGSFCDL